MSEDVNKPDFSFPVPPCRLDASLKFPELSEKLDRFRTETTKALGIFSPFEGGPCPLRLRVNIYQPGCEFRCKFCYVWQGNTPRPDRGILRKLKKDMALAKDCGLAACPVMVSCSSDPFQPMDRSHGYTKRVLELLISEGFAVILLTQNPSQLSSKTLLKY